VRNCAFILVVCWITRIFGSKSDEIIGGWRKFDSEDLPKLYSSPNIIKMIRSRRMRWTDHVARMGEKRNAYRVLAGKPEGE
jgi:hypothetical protein